MKPIVAVVGCNKTLNENYSSEDNRKYLKELNIPEEVPNKSFKEIIEKEIEMLHK